MQAETNVVIRCVFAVYSHSSLPSSGTSKMQDDASLCVPRLVWLRRVSPPPPPVSRWSGVSEQRGSNSGAATQPSTPAIYPVTHHCDSTAHMHDANQGRHISAKHGLKCSLNWSKPVWQKLLCLHYLEANKQTNKYWCCYETASLH